MGRIDKELEGIIDGVKCPKDFKCCRSGFKDLCKAQDVGIESFLECLEEEPFEWEPLEVTDGSPLVVQDTRRLGPDGRLLAPYYEELVPAGTLLSTHLKVVDRPSHPHLSGWLKSPGEELAGVLYDYAYDCVEFERERALFAMEESQLPAFAQRNFEELKRYYDNLLFDELDEPFEQILDDFLLGRFGSKADEIKPIYRQWMQRMDDHGEQGQCFHPDSDIFLAVYDSKMIRKAIP